MGNEKLHQELVELRARIKPQAEWAGVQDRIDQRAVERRITLLKNYLEQNLDQQSADARKGD